MQKYRQNSEYRLSQEQQYSVLSKTNRKLFKRITNSNYRNILNKSRVSNKSNNSIGSVALRRTQLSNDKIYSRQEQWHKLNISQQPKDISTLYQLNQLNTQAINTPNIQNYSNYQQRIKQTLSQKQLGSQSTKSYRSKPTHYKKPSKHDIEKLFMMDSEKGSRKILNKRQMSNSSKKSSRYDINSPKQSIRDQRQSNHKNIDLRQNIRPIKSIKSNLRSQVKSPKMERERAEFMSKQNYQINQIKKLREKYGNLYHKDAKMSEKQKYPQNQMYRATEETQASKQKYRNKKYEEYKKSISNKQIQSHQESSRILTNYQSQKYLPKMGYNEYDRQESKSRRNRKQFLLEPESSFDNEYNHYKRLHKQIKHIAPRQRGSNQIVKNYHQSSKQKSHRKYRKYTQNNELNVETSQDIEIQDYRHRQVTNKKSKNIVNRIDKSIRSNILDNSEYHNQRKDFLKQIKIKNKMYQNLYGLPEQSQFSVYYEYKRHNNRQNTYNDQIRTPQSHYPRSPKHRVSNDNEYNFQSHSKNTILKTQPTQSRSPNPSQLPRQQHKSKGKISQTLDSLVLSINSRLMSTDTTSKVKTIKTNQKQIKPTIQQTIDKINLHLMTITIIADYSNEFNKMYEDTEPWEELIFLSYKKYWIERVKIINYLKKHLKKNDSNKLANKSIPLSADNSNPFIFIFNKISQKQCVSLIKTSQGEQFLNNLQQETIKNYHQLQQIYNFIISKTEQNPSLNMNYCDDFSDEIYIMILQQIDQLIPNLDSKRVSQITKIRLGRILKAGLVIAYLNGKTIPNIQQILSHADTHTINNKRTIKSSTTYDLYYEIFQNAIAS